MMRFDTGTSSTLLIDLRDSGNGRAWALFLERYKSLIAAYARRRGLQPADADDVSQEVLLAFVTAHRAGRYDKDKGRFRSWLGRIAANKTSDALKRLMGRETQAIDEPSRTGFFEKVGQAEADGHERLWQQEWERFVLETCTRGVSMEFDQMTLVAFERYAVKGEQAEWVAKELGISRNAVYIAKNRVLERMRSIRCMLEADQDVT
jgi:RNA polymerase sigma-70 factor (ECF subfamily)